MLFSLIVPVFNRPEEIYELLESLSLQSFKDFEVIIVEDGSDIDCKKEVESFSDKLEIQYLFKENEKPAIARNFGVKNANGKYVVFTDSDCILPFDYFEKIKNNLSVEEVDVFGGPDKADTNFNSMQKAISYSMTAFLTTGNIRGGQKVDKFYPRSFNLGIKREVFVQMGGFPVTGMHPGEDMVFAVELIKRGYKTKLFKDIFVYHKRRNNMKSFFKQVFRFGKTRHIISKVYPETFKIFYLIPSLFTGFFILSFFLAFVNIFFLAPIFFYGILIFFDSFKKNKSIKVAVISVFTSFVQLFGYGTGFLQPFFRKDEFGVLQKGFYN
jgi:glycosyltransferase involved in cell wall biosynthesis